MENASKKSEIILQLTPIFISVIPIMLLWWQIVLSENRAKSNATMEYFSKSIDNYQPLFQRLEKKLTLDDIARPAPKFILDSIENYPEFREEIELYLTFAETIAVGINNQVYDIKLVNDLLGGRILESGTFFHDYIQNLQDNGPNKNRYHEFQILVSKLQIFRNEQSKMIDKGKTKICRCKCCYKKNH